ncbi:NAD-binding protein [Bradymonas sediminis]|uniref:BK channel n=1 Tax=Bradymonas sediminis TaxID=1548548 RepID=A0A2Z4FJY9_9DELT|nr:NAD-binding protein [Bradymonas sediminis]AWV89190.1 hypothetical protein DN745_07490 [Bradymonas sediminis]TDP64343.1 voltage-gated potassium channel [Bradymonas sediminis]
MNRKRQIRRFLEAPAVEVVIALLIVISVGLLFVEVGTPTDSPDYAKIVFINDLLTLGFIGELFLRFYAEPRKERFFRKCWYDILAVLPALRILRVFRMLRLLRLYRVSLLAMERLKERSGLFKVVRVEYLMIALGLFTATLMGGLSMRVAEGGYNGEFGTFEQTLWYAVMTIIAGEPTGGDPTSSLGRFITLSLMITGLTLFAVLTGTVSAVMIDLLKDIRISGMELEDLDEHVIICGWNPSGSVILSELLHDHKKSDPSKKRRSRRRKKKSDLDTKQYVIISEADSVCVDEVVSQHPGRVMTMVGDYTRLEVLKRARIERASTAILLADATIPGRSAQDQDARSVLAAMLVEKAGSDIYTIVQLNNRDNETSLKGMGVEEIIVSEEYVGNLVATMTRNKGIVTILDDLLTAKYGEQFFREEIPAEMVGMDVGEAIPHLKRNYDAILIAVDLNNGNCGRDGFLVNPPVDFKLEAGHRLFVAAPESLS